MTLVLPLPLHHHPPPHARPAGVTMVTHGGIAIAVAAVAAVLAVVPAVDAAATIMAVVMQGRVAAMEPPASPESHAARSAQSRQGRQTRAVPPRPRLPLVHRQRRQGVVCRCIAALAATALPRVVISQTGKRRQLQRPRHRLALPWQRQQQFLQGRLQTCMWRLHLARRRSKRRRRSGKPCSCVRLSVGGPPNRRAKRAQA